MRKRFVSTIACILSILALTSGQAMANAQAARAPFNTTHSGCNRYICIELDYYGAADSYVVRAYHRDNANPSDQGPWHGYFVFWDDDGMNYVTGTQWWSTFERTTEYWGQNASKVCVEGWFYRGGVLNSVGLPCVYPG